MKRPIETFGSSTPPVGLLVGQRDAPPGPVDLQMVFVMHHAFRRDVTAFERRVHGQKLVDVIATSRFLARRKVVVPGAVTATTALLGRPPRSYSDDVAERARMTSPSTSRDRQHAHGH